MDYKTITQKINEAKPIWHCHPSTGTHDVGCSHKDCTKEELWEALVLKKKFEASGLAGITLSE